MIEDDDLSYQKLARADFGPTNQHMSEEQKEDIIKLCSLYFVLIKARPSGICASARRV